MFGQPPHGQNTSYWLRHPAWAGIGAIVGILALCFAIFIWFVPRPDALFAPSNSAAQAPTAAGNPYGGTLVASDPMSRPGSAFDWQTGNDGIGDQCTFENNAYHVVGICDSNPNINSTPSISTKFAFEILLNAGQNCGKLHLYFNSQTVSIDVDVCQNGRYKIWGEDPGVSGTATAMHTGTDQSNILGIVADSTGLTLYINYTRVDTLSGNFTNIFGLKLEGFDSSDNRAAVVYSNARLWSF